jgi:hypothetical protein
MRTALAGLAALMLLAGCGEDEPTHTEAEIEAAYDKCTVRVAIAGPGYEYAGPNAAIVGCMRDELDMSFDEAKDYVQSRQEDDRWLEE